MTHKMFNELFELFITKVRTYNCVRIWVQPTTVVQAFGISGFQSILKIYYFDARITQVFCTNIINLFDI